MRPQHFDIWIRVGQAWRPDFAIDQSLPSGSPASIDKHSINRFAEIESNRVPRTHYCGVTGIRWTMYYWRARAEGTILLLCRSKVLPGKDRPLATQTWWQYAIGKHQAKHLHHSRAHLDAASLLDVSGRTRGQVLTYEVWSKTHASTEFRAQYHQAMGSTISPLQSGTAHARHGIRRWTEFYYLCRSTGVSVRRVWRNGHSTVGKSVLIRKHVFFSFVLTFSSHTHRHTRSKVY